MLLGWQAVQLPDELLQRTVGDAGEEVVALLE
jgi:hypothetical protein